MKKKRFFTFNAPGAFIHAEIPKDKNNSMRLRGEFVKIMGVVNPKYRKYVTDKKRKNVLYLHIIRYIYVRIEESMLWYDLYKTVWRSIYTCRNTKG